MGKGGRGWHLGTCPPLEVLESVFLLQMLSETSADEVFMHHFEKRSSAFGGFTLRPYWGDAPGPCWRTSVLQTPSLPTLEKNPVGTHDSVVEQSINQSISVVLFSRSECN